MSDHQMSLFSEERELPEGLKYQPELLAAECEQMLLEGIRELPFREFEFQGYTGKRRVVSYGWEYDFNERLLREADDIPSFIIPLRDVAAEFAGISSAGFQHVLVTEYAAGAGIGWHRDKAEFCEVVGISLLSPCLFRMRRKAGSRWDRVTLRAEPRSAYLLRGPARTEWEHSIPAVDELRYSITFRGLREPCPEKARAKRIVERGKR